ncbi:MAG: rhomboid family intramembrane serine protease [Gammaproteobacteria bacterium]|nr:rhomboid family intramembrane serine protease [Gammaproteobacteria bacterium]
MVDDLARSESRASPSSSQAWLFTGTLSLGSYLLAEFRTRLVAPILYVALIWAVTIAAWLIPGAMAMLALVPRTEYGITGILSMPLVHLGPQHLIANSVPLLMLGCLISIRHGHRYFLTATFTCTGASGLLLWTFGRSAMHIGASGIVFAWFGLLLIQSFLPAPRNATIRLRERVIDVCISVGVMFVYGSMLWGLLPTDQRISWDGHLAGFVGGILTAWLGRHSSWGRKQSQN